jgi:hypothetical protein
MVTILHPSSDCFASQLGGTIPRDRIERLMRNQNASNFAQCLVTGLLTVFLVFFGWVTIVQGGIALKGKAAHISYVGGGFATALALGMFFVATLSGLLLGKALGLGRLGFTVVVSMVILPPLFFLFW